MAHDLPAHWWWSRANLTLDRTWLGGPPTSPAAIIGSRCGRPSHNRMGRDGSWLDAPGSVTVGTRGWGSLSASSSDVLRRGRRPYRVSVWRRRAPPHIRASRRSARERFVDLPCMLFVFERRGRGHKPHLRPPLPQARLSSHRRSAAHRRSSVRIFWLASRAACACWTSCCAATAHGHLSVTQSGRGRFDETRRSTSKRGRAPSTARPARSR